MKKAYEIENRSSGQCLGVYEAEDEDEAIKAMLTDAGCEDKPDPDLVAHQVARCAYCGELVYVHDDHIGTDGYIKQGGVPDLDNDEIWAKLADEHADGCEWVRTRAHRLDD